VVLAHIGAELPAVAKIVDRFEDQVPTPAKRYTGVLVDPPFSEALAPLAGTARVRLPRKLDYAARDEANRRLGSAGEAWVLGYEEARLAGEGRADLVGAIDWVASRLGDGAGYDIKSFHLDGAPRFIEVKTTNGAAITPFVVTQNELEFSREAAEAFFLYRVFDFRALPRLFFLQGELSRSLDLRPIDYRARLKALA
jgi:hypothetical protein